MGIPEIIEYYTYDDYVHWEGSWELIDGVPVAMAPSPMIDHQTVLFDIAGELRNEIKKCPKCMVLGEQDWKIGEYTVLKPDVVLICNEPNLAYITKAPLIVVEIVSPSSAKRDEKYKFKIYEEEKVPYYMLVYPKESKVKIYKLKDDKYSKEGDFFSETYEFSELECRVKIDFKEVFLKNRSF